MYHREGKSCFLNDIDSTVSKNFKNTAWGGGFLLIKCFLCRTCIGSLESLEKLKQNKVKCMVALLVTLGQQR